MGEEKKCITDEHRFYALAVLMVVAIDGDVHVAGLYGRVQNLLEEGKNRTLVVDKETHDKIMWEHLRNGAVNCTDCKVALTPYGHEELKTSKFLALAQRYQASLAK